LWRLLLALPVQLFTLELEQLSPHSSHYAVKADVVAAILARHLVDSIVGYVAISLHKKSHL
jgi:hypothetical protein